MNDWGYNVLIVDSYGPRGLKQDCDSQVPNKLVNSEQRAADAFAVARWAKSQSWNKGKVGMNLRVSCNTKQTGTADKRCLLTRFTRQANAVLNVDM